jgi:hypothetical protein
MSFWLRPVKEQAGDIHAGFSLESVKEKDSKNRRRRSICFREGQAERGQSKLTRNSALRKSA